MKHTRTMTVTVYEAEQFTRMCNEPDADNGRDEAVFDREVDFPGGIRFAVQVIASTEPAEESCWTQGVLFDANGNELGCTEVGESFLGEYTIPDGDNVYEVVVETDMHTHYPNGECPDCGEPIDKLAVNGDACSNCGHVFNTPQPDDDAPGPHPLQQLGHEMRELGNRLLEQDGPKIGVVKAQDLGNDWRAKSHLK